jgi:hypothetical protein
VIKEKTAMKRNRSGRRYDHEFKNNAVALMHAGRTITEVALTYTTVEIEDTAWPAVQLCRP